jgi:ABC-type polysaccharide/polyol phosphate transport system ATPase subunit
MPLIEFDDVDLIYPVREFYSITLKEFIVKGLFRRDYTERWRTIHALRDISFRVDDGERYGIIGNNGAGKSTLLRTIGGIYPVAKGQRNVDGKICALFDIALGFEPQASGWDNIRYRAYLQGETPKSIKGKMQEIAEFTELGEFLNLPLTCYSTGMLMRLAFAIATSVEPEILLVDEVFSTGDLGFQKKAEARMVDFMSKANIVVMVGHNLGFLEKFCTRILWLEKGRVVREGPPDEIVAEYRASFVEGAAIAA